VTLGTRLLAVAGSWGGRRARSPLARRRPV